MENAIIPINVRRADWSYDRETISAIRRRVFIEEQRIPEDMEWDGLDAGAIHVLGGFAGQAPCATGRLLGGGQIGRMAVLPASRGHGFGGLLLVPRATAACHGFSCTPRSVPCRFTCDMASSLTARNSRKPVSCTGPWLGISRVICRESLNFRCLASSRLYG